MTLLHIVFLPLVGVLVLSFFGNRVGLVGVTRIAILSMCPTAILSFYACYNSLILHNTAYIKLSSWVNMGTLTVDWGFLFDPLACLMLLIIASISCLVHLYSLDYMSQDPHLSRFMSYLSLFTFCMIILVTADNFLQAFCGWEGVGICSYLLVNFWYDRVQANKSSLKALLVNRVGDFGFFLAIIYIFNSFKSLDFLVIFLLTPYVYWKTPGNGAVFLTIDSFPHSITIICLLLLVGAVGKSAQLLLHTWLPDAMEGPTPVSALIHAATMVTAGIFLIIRSSPLFEFAPSILLIITFVGAMTAFFAGTVACMQDDVKKIIAYSTCSQLGYMMCMCGLSFYHASLFHVINHAFIKALLFLSAGIIIHGLGNEQDTRAMGGLSNLFFYTESAVILGCASLSAVTFLSGALSKDFIIAAGSFDVHFANLIFWFNLTSAILTAIYASDIYDLLFDEQSSGPSSYYFLSGEATLKMVFSTGVLAMGSVASGFYLQDFIVSFNSELFGLYLLENPIASSGLLVEYSPLEVKCLPVFSGLLIAGVFIQFNSMYYNKYYFDKVQGRASVLFFRINRLFTVIDTGFIEYFGPAGIVSRTYALSRNVTNYQAGRFETALILLLSMAVFLVFFGSQGASATAVDSNLSSAEMLTFFLLAVTTPPTVDSINAAAATTATVYSDRLPG